MATVKLTLSADEDTVSLAKSIASEENTSVSKLFKQLITELAKKRKKEDPLLEKIRNTEIPEWIKNLSIGSVDLPEDFDYKEARYEYLKEKYGL